MVDSIVFIQNGANFMKNKYLTAALSLFLLVIASIAAYTVPMPELPEEITEEAASPSVNPLTGATAEEGFDEGALEHRIAAFVVENSPDARPQWGLDDPDYSPDIVLQGEVEGGITRTLWMYADYSKLPEIIGPMRSARPPYIRFSELFDAIFIHWGMSGSKGNYIGASEVFRTDGVDHINQMTFNDKLGLYGRDMTRSTAIEHRGILYGDKVEAAIKQRGFRQKPKEYTHLSFSSLGSLSAFIPADSLQVTYSSRTVGANTFWSYNKEDGMYHTSDFGNDFTRDNLLVLYDETEYISKDNYGGHGYSLDYCDYKFAGGDGLLLSGGRAKEIKWEVRDGQLVLVDVAASKTAQARAEAEAESTDTGEGAADKRTDVEVVKSSADDRENSGADGNTGEGQESAEAVEVPAAISPGKTWIGWISVNNGGSAVLTEQPS